MEFAGGDTPAANDHHLFAGLPPPQGDSMQVIRDALLSQLQKDRLRQEIIVAELARIERAMALRDAGSYHGTASSSANPEGPNPNPAVPLVPHGTGTVGPELHSVGAEDAHGLKLECPGVQIKSEKPSMEDDLVCKPANPVAQSAVNEHSMPHDVKIENLEDGLHGGVRIKSEKPSMEDDPVSEGSKQSDTDKQESNQAVVPEKTLPSVKWSCSICKVETTSEGNLLQHFAGQKHLVNLLTLKAKARAEKARKAKQYAGKPHPTWACRFCPANCTGKSVLENHLKGQKHHAKIQALLEECQRMMARAHASGEADSSPNMVTQDDAEKLADSLLFCSVCHAKCSNPSILESHVRGKKHQMNLQALKLEAKRLGIIPPPIAKKQLQAPPEWDCSICQAKCNSESQFHDHSRSMGHRQKVEALQREGTNAPLSGLETGKKSPTDGSSSSNGASSDGEIQKALYLCRLCNLQCNSKNTLAEHRQGKKHLEKVQIRMLSSFCHACCLQCNSEKMLAHHCAGSKHQANLNGC